MRVSCCSWIFPISDERPEFQVMNVMNFHMMNVSNDECYELSNDERYEFQMNFSGKMPTPYM
jgi:hypothetical protein